MEIKVLNRAQLEQILEMPAVIEGVKGVYKAKSEGNTAVWLWIEGRISRRMRRHKEA